MRGYRIHLIACGKPEVKPGVLYPGRTDVPLSKEGRENLVALKAAYGYPEVERVYSSPLKRCTETAALLYPHQKLFVDGNLTELDTGIFTGKQADWLKGNMYFRDFMKAGLKYDIPEGENGPDFVARCVVAYQNIFNNMLTDQMRDVAVITHPGVILCLLTAMGVPKYPANKLLLKPGTGWTTLITPDLWMRSRAFELYEPLPAKDPED